MGLGFRIAGRFQRQSSFPPTHAVRLACRWASSARLAKWHLRGCTGLLQARNAFKRSSPWHKAEIEPLSRSHERLLCLSVLLPSGFCAELAVAIPWSGLLSVWPSRVHGKAHCIGERMLSRFQAVFAFPRFAIGCEDCRKGALHRLLTASKNDGFLELSTGCSLCS